MLKNYFLVAIRNLRHNKLFSLINVLGLAIGISASLVIFLIVRYDFSFDRFEPDGDRIYRVVSDYNFAGNEGHTRGTQSPLAQAVKKELAGPDLVVSFRYYSAGKLSVPAPSLTDRAAATKPATFKNPEHLIFADDAYFKLLPYQWLAGSPASALAEPRHVVLSESRAKLYFPMLPYADIMGRTIVYDDTISARVSGIVRDLDSQYHSDFNFKEFISLSTVLNNTSLRQQFYWDNWGGSTSDQQLYVRLVKAVNPATVDARLKVLFDKYQGEDARKNKYSWAWRLQPLSDLHFNDKYGNFHVDLASKPSLYGLMLVALFLLLLASINFINLATAQATQRAKEIGVRKTLGGSRRQLMVQFLTETFLITCVATVVSVLVAPLLLMAFTDYIPQGLSFFPLQPSIVVFLIALIVVVSLLAGLYPAMVLSSSNALLALKNQAHAGTAKTRGAWVRQSLTVSQFVIAQFFIMGALLVGKQIRFMTDKDLGFGKEAILSFETPYRDTSYLHRVYLLDQVKQLPGVRMATLGSDVPFSWGWWTNTLDYKDGKKEVHLVVEAKAGDSNYLRLFQIPLLAGRNLLPSDSAKEVIINEACLHALGFRQPQAAIGKIVNWDTEQLAIVGVMKDFHAHPINYEIKPLVFRRMPQNSRDIIVALRRPAGATPDGSSDHAGWQSAIAGMKAAFGKTYSQDDFSYNFLDESIAGAYKDQQRMLQLLNWATGLTVFISCLGLLGLVIYIINRRTKEIGVRKVLGASVAQIVSILSKEFLLLVAVAFAIATPLSWWASHVWLQDFAYRTAVSWWVFFAGGVAMTAIALITLSVQTVRAAMANPVNALRAD
ncbi:MAG TPA: FtsX-like permease family protein [Puia sp.]|nr:FtsX-like permease family protein [Puia sp.]